MDRVLQNLDLVTIKSDFLFRSYLRGGGWMLTLRLNVLAGPSTDGLGPEARKTKDVRRPSHTHMPD